MILGKAYMGIWVFFVLFLYLQLIYKIEIISK